MIRSKTGRAMHENTRKALLKAVQRPKSQSHRGGTLPPNGRPWTKAEDKRLGKPLDRILTLELDRSVDSIQKRRTRMKIPKYQGTRVRKS